MERHKNLVDGWLVFDKPKGLSSMHAVSRIKRLFGAKKAGHAGTLDPLATGVLPVAFGEATKTIPYLVEANKNYRFCVSWGLQTTTDDRQGEPLNTSDRRPSRSEIEQILPEFTGQITQIPPRFSALKIDGARAYDLARKGEDFELQPRAVILYSFKLLEHQENDHSLFQIECSKGTYVRALARDMGVLLGCYGHVSELRRIGVGSFSEERTISLEKLEELRHSAAGCEALYHVLEPVHSVLDDIPAVEMSGDDAERLKRGQSVLLRGRDAPVIRGPICAMSRGMLVAIGEVKRGAVHPTRVFNLAR